MKKLVSYCAALLLLISTAQAQQKLQLNLKKGESYQQVTLNDASITQEILGQSMEITLGVSSSMSFTVLNVNRDGYDMQVSFNYMKLSMGSLQSKMEFDSENPDEDDAFSQIMSGVVGESFNIKMSKSGKVLEISGIEAMWEKAFENQNISGAEKAEIITQLNQTYGSEAIKGNIEMVSAIFPENKVSKGDQWTNDVNINSGMKGLASTTYTYMGSEEDRHLISGSGEITTSEEGSKINTNGLELTMNLNGIMESEIAIDAATGWIVEATVNQKIDGTANMEANEQMPTGLTIPMKIRNEMQVTDK